MVGWFGFFCLVFFFFWGGFHRSYKNALLNKINFLLCRLVRPVFASDGYGRRCVSSSAVAGKAHPSVRAPRSPLSELVLHGTGFCVKFSVGQRPLPLAARLVMTDVSSAQGRRYVKNTVKTERDSKVSFNCWIFFYPLVMQNPST